MDTYYEKCVDELKLQLCAMNRVRMAFEVLSPDGSVAPDGSVLPRDDITKEGFDEFLDFYETWKSIADLHHKEFRILAEGLKKDLGRSKGWPPEIAHLLLDIYRARPRHMQTVENAHVVMYDDGKLTPIYA